MGLSRVLFQHIHVYQSLSVATLHILDTIRSGGSQRKIYKNIAHIFRHHSAAGKQVIIKQLRHAYSLPVKVEPKTAVVQFL